MTEHRIRIDLEEGELEVTIFKSPLDGAIVVQVDTDSPAEGMHVRINLNDAPVWDGDPERESYREVAARIVNTELYGN